MDFNDCVKFANENKMCSLATADGDQPRVRAMGMHYADDTGFYFNTESTKALAKQLIVYKRYREIAGILIQREEDGLRTYLRLAPPPKLESNYDLTGISIDDIAAAAQEIFTDLNRGDALQSVVPPSRVTIREKITIITNQLRHRKNVSFRSLVNHENSRLDIVVTFLALLELIKRHLVRVSQEGLFGDITLEVSEAWDDYDELETEFGE